MAEKIWIPKSKDDLIKLINANISLSCIDISLITDMSEIFKDSKRTDFSGLEKWNVSNVTTMKDMFCGAKHFNHNINAWDTSSVRNMAGMFGEAINFNQPLDKWNVANVENMSLMFCYAHSFNQNINSWDTSSVRNMHGMFFEADSFNQPLDKWNVANVKDMDYMFSHATLFNQNLDSWNIREEAINSFMFKNTQLEANQTLPKWFQKFLAEKTQKES